MTRKGPSAPPIRDVMYNKQGDMGHSDPNDEMFPQIRNPNRQK